MWYTYRMQSLFTSIVDRYIEAFQAAEELETALANQKGFVSYYLLEGDAEWLSKLGENRQIFKEQLNKAKNLAEAEEQKEKLEQIEWENAVYIASKDRVIDYYRKGEVEQGTRLHSEVRAHFNKILEMCEQHKETYREIIRQARIKSGRQGARLRIVAGSAIIMVIFLGFLLIFVLFKQILFPLRKLAMEVYRQGDNYESDDEIKALSRSVHELIEDIDYTHFELEKSRESLLQSEKMALVGRLAAGMAHSIRNPLTSVKMRLFSLSRNLDLTPNQEEDFEVISEEIRHTDTIVQNFLEFSRPPKLKMQKISPSEVVDLAIQLLEHRLKAYDVEARIDRSGSLPEIEIDPEQLKEVIVNIVVNACEAMGRGGAITISEEKSGDRFTGEKACIKITDNGPGIPKSVKGKVLQPFFTTKDEGTGLGLSIAVRIVEQHRGTLSVESKEGEGTSFIIMLPVKSSKGVKN